MGDAKEKGKSQAKGGTAQEKGVERQKGRTFLNQGQMIGPRVVIYFSPSKDSAKRVGSS